MNRLYAGMAVLCCSLLACPALADSISPFAFQNNYQNQLPLTWSPLLGPNQFPSSGAPSLGFGALLWNANGVVTMTLTIGAQSQTITFAVHFLDCHCTPEIVQSFFVDR